MRYPDAEKARIILGLLESVDRDSARSQRVRASEFGIALGLVNSYLKFCIRKGFIKVKRLPAQRYLYFITPKGFAEKSRLTVEHLSNSLTFFRQARSDCSQLMRAAEERGWKRLALFGASELAEISTLCALETGLTITAVVDRSFAGSTVIGLPVVGSLDAAKPFDAVIITDRRSPQESFNIVVNALGAELVLAPSVLGIASSRGMAHLGGNRQANSS